MPQTREARQQILLDMLSDFPAELTIRPTPKIIINQFTKITPVELKYLTYWLNGLTDETIASQLEIEPNTVRTALHKAHQQVKNLDELCDYYDSNIHLNPGIIAGKLIQAGYFKIVEPVGKA